MNKRVITIGREFGSGGREIGIKLSKRLSIPFYDKELLKLTSEEGRFDEKFLAANEEKAPILASPSLGRIALSSFYQPSLSDTIFLEQSKIIKEIAQRGPCVIVGRCADYVLKDEGSLDVFICAGMPYKIKRKRLVAPEKQAFSDEEMEKYIRDVDKQRTKYYEHYTGRHWGHVGNYHLCLFVDHIGSDGAVETIITYLENWK